MTAVALAAGAETVVRDGSAVRVAVADAGLVEVAVAVAMEVEVGAGVGVDVRVLVDVEVAREAGVTAAVGVGNPVLDAAAGTTPLSETKPIITISALRKNLRDPKVI